MKSKKVTLQSNSKSFTGIVKKLYPEEFNSKRKGRNNSMANATHKLSQDLYRAIMFKEDIIKKFRKKLK